MNKKVQKINFDEHFSREEQLPRKFSVLFKEVGSPTRPAVKVSYNDEPLGDVINDNAYGNDFYRYHDIFHYTFATLLGWSPCARAMLRKKRKSDAIIDTIEDGARAAITEEAISLIIFNEAKRKAFFEHHRKVSKTTLRIIKEMTENFEVKYRSGADWEFAILRSYDIFRKLITHQGGKVDFDMVMKEIEFSTIN